MKTAGTFEIPKGTPRAHRKACRAEVYWIKTKAGRNMPVNPDGVSHFATCSDADRFRKAK